VRIIAGSRKGARIFAPTIPLMLASIRLWQGLEAELGCDLLVRIVLELPQQQSLALSRRNR
jgi:hypothetical protein